MVEFIIIVYCLWNFCKVIYETTTENTINENNNTFLLAAPSCKKVLTLKNLYLSFYSILYLLFILTDELLELV